MRSPFREIVGARRVLVSRHRPSTAPTLATAAALDDTELTLASLSDHVDDVEAASIAADADLDSRVDIIETNFTTKLVNLGALVGTADNVPYFTGASTWALASLTPYARTIIACANAAAARGVLGLGSLAVLSTVTEADITLANNVTNDVSITKHGFAPILPNDATKYLDGSGAWSTPAGGGAEPAFPTIGSTIYEDWRFYGSALTLVDGRISQVTGSINGRTWVQATAAQRPYYYPKRFNGGYECAFFSGRNPGNRMTHTPAATKALPFTVVAIIEDYTGGVGNQNFVNTGTIIWFTSAGNWVCYNGTVAQHTTSGALGGTVPLLDGGTKHPVCGIMLWNGASSVVNAWGTEQTVNAGTASANALTNATAVNLGDDGAGTGWARVKLRRLIFIEGTLSLAERQAIITWASDYRIAGIPSPI